MGVKNVGADELAEVDPEILLLEPRETFDEALVGYVERCGQEIIACYDYNQTIDALMKHDDMNAEEAQEWFQFNVIGAWVGHRTPCFLFRRSV